MARKSVISQDNPVDEFYDWLNEYLDEGEGMSAAGLADAVGVSRQYIYELKKRKAIPSGVLMHKIAVAMGGRVVLERTDKLCRV